MPLVALQNISRHYDSTRAVENASLAVERGEFFGLLGPSGCGKTTTLRMIAGLETPDSGTIEYDGRDITRLTPEARGFGMVFQNYALFPHLNVFENVGFGLRARRKPTSEIAERVAQRSQDDSAVRYREKAKAQRLQANIIRSLLMGKH